MLLHGGAPDFVVLEPRAGRAHPRRGLRPARRRSTSRRGLDHLLFLAGLLALFVPARRLASHAHRLHRRSQPHPSLVALGVAAPPAGARRDRDRREPRRSSPSSDRARRGGAPGPFARRPFALALGFGLLHGLGFAGALRETGLPDASLPLAVGAFHAGVEAAQLGAWLVLAAAAAALRRAPPAAAPRRAFAWGLGAFGALLLVDRLAALLGTVLSS